MKPAKEKEYFLKLGQECMKYFNLLIYGTAGSGKTTLGIRIQRVLCDIAIKIDKRVLVTAYQRSCVSSWITRVCKENKKSKNKKNK